MSINPNIIITSPNSKYSKMINKLIDELSIDNFLIIEGAFETAVKLVLEALDNYDISAIISRGFTAKLLQKFTDVPILQAEETSFDILTSILEAFKISDKVALIQYKENFNEDLINILSILNFRISIYYYITNSDIEMIINKAKSDSNEVVVCGSRDAEELCKINGLQAILFDTSKKTMRELIQRALLIKYAQDRQSHYKNQLITMINEMPDGVIYINENYIITLINKVGLKLFEIINEKEILGHAINEYILGNDFINIINKERSVSGEIIDFLNKKIIVRSVPVFDSENYIGTVIIIQEASNISNLEHKIRRQSIQKGMVALNTFKDIERTSYSKNMIDCINRAKLYSQTDSTILITGESGTGKEMFAQSIHNASKRQNHPFIAINCAALPENLLESELFGYEEGAFSGAKKGGKPGYFELAHNGTLFLDEIGLIPLHVQVALLRVLQEKQVIRIGGNKVIPVNIRIISATNENLLLAVEKGTFRHDLYFRLNVLNITIPPLRERRKDIPALVKYYMTYYNAINNKNINSFSQDFIEAFQNHDWPGNIRELMNYMMRIIILSINENITINDIINNEINLNNMNETKIHKNFSINNNDNNTINLYPATLDNLELSIINWCMEYYEGDRSKVCTVLGISRTTLWKKLKNISN